MNDSGVNFVIDLTCAQFGNRFVEKFIWTFETWEKTFRSPICKHVITDFDGNVLTYNIVPKDKFNSYEQQQVIDNEKIGIKAALHKNPMLSDKEIDVMTDFFAKRMDEINCKLINGTINNFDVKYIDLVTNCLGDEVPEQGHAQKIHQNLHQKWFRCQSLYVVLQQHGRRFRVMLVW